MKKLMIVTMALLVLCFAGCGKKTDSVSGSTKEADSLEVKE